MGKIGECRSTFGKLSSIPPKIIDLVAAATNPTEIDISTSTIDVQLAIYVSAAFHWTVAPDQATANARIASNATRGYLPSGFYNFSIVGVSGYNFYIRAASGALVTDGISYSFVEAD